MQILKHVEQQIATSMSTRGKLSRSFYRQVSNCSNQSAQLSHIEKAQILLQHTVNQTIFIACFLPKHPILRSKTAHGNHSTVSWRWSNGIKTIARLEVSAWRQNFNMATMLRTYGQDRGFYLLYHDTAHAHTN